MLPGWIVSRKIRFAGLILLVLLTAGWQQPQSSGLPTAAEVNSVLKEISAVTGFRVRKQLLFERITRDQVNDYLRQQIKHSVKPDEIRAEEVTLKEFGFAPADFDLKQTTIDLLTEQAAAFYDFQQKRLFISDWAAVNIRDQALIHELAHALADQNFPIQKYLSKAADNSEESTARQAVVEGQATWLALEVAARRNGKTLANAQTPIQLLRTEPAADDHGDFPVFNKAPLYIRKSLIFPYQDGERLQQAVFLHDGQGAFGRVFQKAPLSTAQIMHPDLYFENIAPSSPDLPKPSGNARAFVEGPFGELDTHILLQQFVNDDVADTLAPKLRGAAYRIDEVKKSHRQMLVYVSEWNDEESASRYFEAYRKVLRGKWKKVNVEVESADRFAGKSEDGYFEVVCDGRKVVSREGFGEPL